MNKKKIKIALFLKKEKPHTVKVIDYLSKIGNLHVFETSNKIIDKKIFNYKYDFIISYISAWILPKKFLNKTKYFNINFHPGPPEYPGIGCFNFALYDEVKRYGVTVHHMLNKVDTGDIIDCEFFKLNSYETVESLSNKSYVAMFKLFKRTIKKAQENDLQLNRSSYRWLRSPFTRTQLNKLSTLKPNMSKKELNKRIRCTYFKNKPLPTITFKGIKFEYKEE